MQVDDELVATIGTGLLVFCGFGKNDSEDQLRPMAEKLAHLRIFPDEQGRFHHSVLEVDAGVLLVPQFTLYADTSKGRRPEFFSAKPPAQATKLFDAFVAAVQLSGVKQVERGIFGAHMRVGLENDGPVTISLEN